MKIGQLFKFLFDKKIPFREKWLIIVCITYIISPIDLIPLPVFGLSFVDDLIVLFFLISLSKAKIEKYYGGEVKSSSKDIKGKTVIDGVEYEVKDE